MRNLRSLSWLPAVLVTTGLAFATLANAQDKPAPAAASAPAAATGPAPQLRTTLPQEHDYQQQLHKFLASLTEKDFDTAIKDQPTAAPIADADELYRTWLVTLAFPPVGGRQLNWPSLALPAAQFTLAAIENPQKGVMRPYCWPEPLAWLANWNYKGNPYYGARAVKLRAFVTVAVLMLMTDDLQEHSGSPKDTRSDWFGLHLAAYAYTYGAVKDAIPAEAQAAFETCLKKMMQRVAAWGPKGDETHFDICAVLAMRLAADTMKDKDPEVAKIAEAYARRVFSDESYYNPAGYFPDQGCIDAGYQGMSLYWATWLALAAPDWAFVQDAVKQTWRMRSYMVLPDPNGKLVGPTHFNARLSSDFTNDQREWPFRAVGAAFLTDDAACWAKSPTAEQLQNVPAEMVRMFGMQLALPPADKLVSRPWRWTLWPSAGDYPMNNYAHDFYPKGYAARRQDLEKKGSPLLKFPFARDGAFTEAFAKVFLAAKRPAFGAIIHTGPVSEFKPGHIEMTGPYGLSGGCLSAFWTPATGAVILGRRGGMAPGLDKPMNNDKAEAWRTWPVHAVIGATADGKFFTSARCQKPDAAYDLQGGKAKVSVAGTIPSVAMGTERSIEGRIDYTRAFEVSDTALRVETKVTGDGKDSVAELYEALPVYLVDKGDRSKPIPTTIEFQAGGKWTPASDQYAEKVTAVRLARFAGAVVVTFDQPRRVKLAPAEWADTWFTRAACRNVLIDLLENGDKPGPVKAASVSYQISAAAK